MTTTHHGYSPSQIAIHWIVAALVVFNWFVGDQMSEVFDAVHEGEGSVPSLTPAYVHIAVGVAVLLLMLVRLFRRASRPVATAPDSPNRVLAMLGKLNHYVFYGLLLLLPLIGAVAWFGGLEEAGELHTFLADALMVLVLLHVAAALFHQFVLGDGLIGRMLRPERGT